MEDYLSAHQKSDILKILQDTDHKKHYAVNINFIELFEYDTTMGNNIFKNPDEALEELDEWIMDAQNVFIEEAEDSSLTVKPSLHARVYCLPVCPQLHRNIFPKNEDLNMFLQILGTVVRVTVPKMLEYRRPYICTKCKQCTVVDAIYDQKYIIIPPKKCSNPDGCPGKNFINSGDLKAENCKDYQEVKIQASMVCKLRTRCSILAATNPKGGNLDPSQPLSLNLTLKGPLLSRFDVVLMLSDTYDSEWNNLVALHILSGKGMGPAKTDPSFWNLEMLQQYFRIIRSLNPALTPSTNEILSTYYQAQRRATFRNKARTTVRLLDSLVRLSQAHARLMFHEEVHVMDALFAVVLIENSMHGECAVLSLDKVNVQAPFPAAPMESYAHLAVTVLGKLNLEDILKNELSSLSNGYAYNSSISNSENVSTSQISAELNGSKPNLISETTRVEDTFENMDDNASFIQTDVKENMQSVHFVNNDAKLKKKIEDICDSSPDKQVLKAKSGNTGKKRNRLKSEEQKQTKNAKNNSDLNDFQMLNLIPSVNDDFDMEILNFTSEDDNQPLLQIQNNSDFLSEGVENAILSQTTKLKKAILEKFAFKPRQLDKKINEKVIETNSTDQQTDSILKNKVNDLEGNDGISGHDKSVNSNLNKSLLQISQSIFKGEDEDYDCLDF